MIDPDLKIIRRCGTYAFLYSILSNKYQLTPLLGKGDIWSRAVPGGLLVVFCFLPISINVQILQNAKKNSERKKKTLHTQRFKKDVTWPGRPAAALKRTSSKAVSGLLRAYHQYTDWHGEGRGVDPFYDYFLLERANMFLRRDLVRILL